ncbi:MAG: DUF4440 domain-containing protein [Planctomycetota bacterium]|jgi:ketosteroid isomerase-like protein
MLLRSASLTCLFGLLALHLVASSVGCTAPEAAHDPAHAGAALDADVLRRADREFAADVAERGLEAWIEWFTPGAVKLDMHEAPRVGLEAIAEGDAPLFADPALELSWEPDLAGWLEPGRRGFTRGAWQFSQRDGSGTIASGRYVTLWVLTEAGWRVELDMGIQDA